MGVSGWAALQPRGNSGAQTPFLEALPFPMPMDFFLDRQLVGPGRKGAWRTVLVLFQGLKVGHINFSYILLARISHMALPSYKGRWEQSVAGFSGGKGN